MRKAIRLLFACSCLLPAATTQQPMFLARRDYPLLGGGGWAAVGDVTGDGISDIVDVSTGYSINTMVGNGNGTFQNAVTYTQGWQFQDGAALVDLNGNGRKDLIIGGAPTSASGGGIGVFFSNSDGTFQQPAFYGVSDGELGNPAVGDFNGDGIPDVVAGGTKGVWFFAGKGGGVFSPGVLTPINRQGLWVAPADFNGDGKLDLAVSTYPHGLCVLMGNGNGTFQAPVFLSNIGWAYIAVGDVIGNGRQDIIVPGNTIYLNDGQGGFPRRIADPASGEGGAVGDVNGDGIPDLVGSNGCVALGLGNGDFAPEVCYPVANTGASFSVVLTDLTKSKKGYDDIVAGLNASISVLLNEGNGTFIDGEWTSVPGSGNCGAAADFNGEGKPDLAVPTTNGIVVMLGTGEGKTPYTTGATIPLSGPGCPISGDVNNDGIPDLLVGADSLGGVGVYLGNGDGTFELASVIPFGPANDIVLGYFNHDGNLGVATSSNQMALGNGDGTFQAPVPILADPPPQGFTWIAAGDVNNDGWTDLLATQPFIGKGDLYVLLNNQQGGFTLGAIADSTGPQAVMLADLTGNGDLDAVVTGAIAAEVYLGNGLGGFTVVQQNIGFPFVDVAPVQIGDVNGDGIPDLLLAADGSIGIALGNGDGTFPAPFVEGAGSGLGQVFLQNLHGQSPKAGLPDISAPDSTGGITVLINLTK